jgi:hypothetical protein
MTAEAILAIIEGLSSALPELLALFSKANTSGAAAVSPTDVQTVLVKYGVDQAVFSSAIAAAKAAGK